MVSNVGKELNLNLPHSRFDTTIAKTEARRCGGKTFVVYNFDLQNVDF